MSTRVALSLLLVAVTTAMAGRARAWDNAPMCMAVVQQDPGPSWSEASSQGHTAGQSHAAGQGHAAGSVGLCSTEDTHRPWLEPADRGGVRDTESTRADWNQASSLSAAGHKEDALLHLRNVERALPRIADRIALERAGLLLDLGMPREACEAFALAAPSPERSIAARAQIGAVQCLIAADDKTAETSLKTLLLRFPLLSERPALEFALALARERWSNPKGAALLLRRIDLEAPASTAGENARAELARLASTGVRVTPFSGRERVERAERLLRDGPIDRAAAEISTINEDRSLNAEVRAQLQELIARIARLRGHFEQARVALQHGTKTKVPAPEADQVPEPATATAPASPEALALTRKIREIRGTKTAAKLTSPQVHTLFDIAVAHGLRPLCDEMLEAMAARKKIAPTLRFDAAMRASGLASDDKLAALLATLLEVPSFGVAARYHYARALERLGHADDAQTEFARVMQEDHSETRYYAMWSGLRRNDGVVKTIAFDASPSVPEARAELDPTARRIRAIELIAPIAERFGSAYPWLLRALDLTELERFDDAADELNEVYLAWRDASGAPRLRSGLLALLTGNAPPRRSVTFAERKGRRALDQQARSVLSQAAVLLGDPGIALRLGTWNFDSLPRAYAPLVESAAHANGLDPNLLFAVMRVESIYNRRIISNAGAVGLMQIMPATGRRIAERTGVAGFDVTDLLNPRLNLDFSAWYLASLLQRFDGRLPLAIASYNGGPHNVRLWMLRNQPDMPLDAFLERIPFSQTHRYVRRVLTHYAEYRAQQNLPMSQLSVELPERRADEMAF